MRKPATVSLALAVGLLAALAAAGQEQHVQVTRPFPEIPFRLAAAEIERFPAAIRLPGREPYTEAVVLKLEVPRKVYEEAPPSRQPYLYIGGVELMPFATGLAADPERIELIFHVPDWARLDEGAPLVLTLDRGAPLRAPEAFRERQDLPRFHRGMLVDRRR